MKLIPNIIATFIIAIWIIAIAIFSVQNATPVVLQFLIFKSIKIPVGIVLAASVSVGAIATILAQMAIIFSPVPENFPLNESNYDEGEDDEQW